MTISRRSTGSWSGGPGAPVHVAFAAEPGLRPEYSGGYYRAFVLDPDGHNVEAVWRFSG